MARTYLKVRENELTGENEVKRTDKSQPSSKGKHEEREKPIFCNFRNACNPS